MNYLAAELSRYQNGTIFFRSMSSATKRERLRAKHRLSWLKAIVAYLREFVVFKDSYIPDFGIKEPTEIAFDEIDAMAADCRKFWGLGKNSINNVMMLFENNGIIITRGILDADKLDVDGAVLHLAWGSAFSCFPFLRYLVLLYNFASNPRRVSVVFEFP